VGQVNREISLMTAFSDRWLELAPARLCQDRAVWSFCSSASQFTAKFRVSCF